MKVSLASQLRNNEAAVMEEPFGNSSNSSYVSEEYLVDPLKATFGPVRDQLYVVIPISIIYASIFVTGTVGNISTCVVIARNKSMHTATNYYLFSLAVSDLLLLIFGLPSEIYQVWYKYPYVFGEAFCILRGLAAETSTNASVLTITAFTAERYVAICHPFLSQTMSKLSRAVKLILFIWLVALACAVPQALQFGIVSYGGPDALMCQYKRQILQFSFELSTFLFFIIPMTLIMVLYILIGLKLKKSTLMKRNCRQQHRRSESTRVKVGSSRMDRHCRHSRSTRRVLKMLVAVVIAFFICWAPFHMQRLIAIYGKKNVYTLDRHYWMEQIYLILTYVSGVLYYVSTTINPILYNIMSNKFREAFMETLARSCRMSRFVMPRERRSYSSLSRSQQRNPATYPSRTTAVSGGTALAQQDSTDCSGNSIREEHQDLRAGANVAEYSSSETPPPPLPALVYGNSKQSSRKSVLAIEIGASDTSLSIMSVGNNAPGQPRGSSGNAGVGSHFVELNRQSGRNHSIGRELPSPGYDRCIRMTGSPARPLQQISVVNCRNKPSQTTSSKKKWWRLLDWLPGLKSIRTSRALTRPTQDNIIAELDQRLPKQPDDYFMQLHTFKAKDESCRPV